jgi:hypothetical protein
VGHASPKTLALATATPGFRTQGAPPWWRPRHVCCCGSVLVRRRKTQGRADARSSVPSERTDRRPFNPEARRWNGKDGGRDGEQSSGQPAHEQDRRCGPHRRCAKRSALRRRGSKADYRARGRGAPAVLRADRTCEALWQEPAGAKSSALLMLADTRRRAPRSVERPRRRGSCIRRS